MKNAIPMMLLLGVATTTMAEPPNWDVRVTNDISEPVPVTVQNQVLPPSAVTIDSDKAPCQSP